jgi:hypothetical protein
MSLFQIFSKRPRLASACEETLLTKKKWMKNYQQNLHLQNFNTMTKLFRTGDFSLPTLFRIGYPFI